MTDSLERFLEDLRFDMPGGLVDRAKAAAVSDAAGARQAARGALHSRGDFEAQRHSWAAALVAVLIAVAIVATLLFVAHDRQAVPATPIPHRATLGATCDTQTSPSVPLRMLSSTMGWAHGALRTTDGGLHWKDMSPPSLTNRTRAYAECFLDSNHAWTAQAIRSGTVAADHIVTFATTNGGRTWQQSVPVALGVRLCANENYTCGGGWGVAPQLFFIDAQQGWLLVGFGRLDDYGDVNSIDSAVLYSTSDGGLHWTMVSSSGSVTNRPATSCLPIVLGVTFVSPTSGWGQTCSPHGPALLVTHDGGVTWNVQRLPAALVNGGEAPLPVFFNDKQGILLGSVLLATSDGGSTWVERSLPPPITSCCGDAVWRVFQVDFLDANTGWAISPGPGWTKGSPVRDWLYRTSDGGQTWTLTQKDLPMGDQVSALLVVDANDAFAATTGSVGPGNELFKTTDGGRTWKVVA
jgi:photosystem II stability/assembly factor-like uncharacterized protein